MFKKALLTGATFLALTASASAGQLISGSEFQYQAWNGGAYSEEGQFSYCVTIAPYGDVGLGFGLTKDFEMMISLFDKSWTLPSNQKLYAQFSIDESTPAEYFGVPVAPDQITFYFKPDPDFLKALTAGKLLTIKTGKTTLNFNLVGTQVAIPQMVKCVGLHRQQANPFDENSSNPFTQK